MAAVADRPAPAVGIETPDLASPRFKVDPYPFYARLRGESPVHAMTLRDGRPAWLVTRYDDVTTVLKDERFVKDKRRLAAGSAQRHRGEGVILRHLLGFLAPLERNMLDVDPPDHTRLRALVHQAFTPRRVEALRTRIEELVEELLDAALRGGRGGAGGTVELIAAYALPLPSVVIADMLGVPASDRHKFHAWSEKIVAVAGARDMLVALPHAWSFLRYLRALIARRRAEPRDDLITALLQAEEAGDRLSEDELLAMVFLLLVAGHETTVNLTASGTLALLQHPEQLARLRKEPALMRTAVEELLRYTSPVQVATERYAVEDVEIAGTRIPRDGLVLVLLGSANRDERQFSEPDTLDVGREPNRHVAFGLGAHYCLGAPLARLEGQIALEALLRRAPGLRLAAPTESLRWRRGLFLRGLEKLPVALAA